LAWTLGEPHADVVAELLGLAGPPGAGRSEHMRAARGTASPSASSSIALAPDRSTNARGEIRPDLICVHGQTIFHQPPISWQLVNPAPIAQRFDCPVVSDLRQADLAAGGQGAPITPLADWVVFRDRHEKASRAVINLGGFCNATVLPRRGGLEGLEGRDLCPCNQVLDAVARRALGQPMDINGAAASAGIADPEAVNTLVSWFNRLTERRRSLGTGDEAIEWVEHHMPRLSAQDLAASAANAIGSYIAIATRAMKVDEIIVAGGGAHNSALVRAIASLAKAPVRPSDELGVPIAAREALAFAVLGALCADGVPITLPNVTGCSGPAPLAGSWTSRVRRATSPSTPLRGRGTSSR
jgi:1,6-anhydro-N-acetylmuramate kinase